MSALLLHGLAQCIMNELPSKYRAVEPAKAMYAGGQLIIFDLYLEGERICIIELELHRENPLHNVAKTLMWLNESFMPQEVTFVQIFDSGFYERHPLDKRLAIFLGQAASHGTLSKSRFSYHYFDVVIPKSCYLSEPKEEPIKAMCQEIFDRIKIVL